MGLWFIMNYDPISLSIWENCSIFLMMNELNIIYNEDCLIGMDKIEDKSIDCVICDLPYAITSNKWDIAIPFDKLWEQYDRVCKDNAMICLFGSQPFSSALVMSNPKMFRHEWIWIKNRGSNFANTVREPMKEHEHILCFSKGKWTYNKQMQPRSGGGLERAKYNVKFESQSSNYRDFEGRLENKLSVLKTNLNQNKELMKNNKSRYSCGSEALIFRQRTLWEEEDPPAQTFCRSQPPGRSSVCYDHGNLILR